MKFLVEMQVPESAVPLLEEILTLRAKFNAKLNELSDWGKNYYVSSRIGIVGTTYMHFGYDKNHNNNLLHDLSELNEIIDIKMQDLNEMLAGSGE